MNFSRSAAALAIVASLIGVTAVAAQPVDRFYAGTQIKLVIGGGVGGGYDFYGRLVARFMGRHLPGHPTFVAPSMPGAAGIIAANYLYNIAPRDGSEIGIVGRAVGTQPLIDPSDKAPKYVATKFNWIGTPQQEIGILVVRQPSPIRTLDDLKSQELVLSGTTLAAPPSSYPRLFNKLLGTKFKVVDGYKTSQEALLAVERGEVDGHLASSAAAPLRARINPWIAEGKVRVLAQIGMSRDPENGDAPLILDLARTTMERQVLELVLAQQVMAWPLLAPPDVPVDRVKALRTAFDATMTDPDFLTEAAKLKVGIDPIGGEKINEMLERLYATPKDVLDRLAELSGSK